MAVAASLSLLLLLFLGGSDSSSSTEERPVVVEETQVVGVRSTLFTPTIEPEVRRVPDGSNLTFGLLGVGVLVLMNKKK